jgi:hypothetical protein
MPETTLEDLIGGSGCKGPAKSLHQMEEGIASGVDRALIEHAARVLPSCKILAGAEASLHARRPWEVIVEPDEEIRLLIVVTAYPVS